jgi:hypothetical protein
MKILLAKRSCSSRDVNSTIVSSLSHLLAPTNITKFS